MDSNQPTTHNRLRSPADALLKPTRLRHKNIVQLFDVYEDRDRVYLIMEL